MANSAKFNRQDVVQKATELYWEKGFHATSMRNLQEVIDMRPGSIYASFGSKEGLFSEALDNYANSSIEQLYACKAEAASPIAALKLFLKKALIDSRETAPSGMCMLVKTVAELTDDNAELLEQTKKLLAKVEAEFTKVLNEAKLAGELQNDKDTAQLARHLQVQIIGLRTYSRAHDGNAPIEQLIEELFEHSSFTAA
ncbi:MULTISPECIES: TetR/AcrR family transcriptional regulator [unclassified Agarivorans]|uniref:TetR/AcrR family transcriptional regulator n=1 Tax=unclassified Agarivorans TaxID=2636026 RepID=UPI0026E3B00E|nr:MULTISPECIES: TetR/AcrR family transcriptional regulator [unclassified Agarivorans]MDO6683911.1 TetR/AcrR family transcriptional regulator [Agarivorans sp. 3_MG-2023]MDO6714356.1 TetR/AcrR family transcriptional regulator [Agarivorans sp. 2_MG-2023]